MSGIRVTYSGLISFAISLVSIVTGLFFTIILTRMLTPTEFGAWNLILSLISYGLVIEPVISYWATREIARGIESGRTAIISSGIFSIVSCVIYIILAHFIGRQSNVEQNILFFAASLIPIMFLNRVLAAINLGHKPQTVSYGLLISEIVKIPVALIFVYFLDMGIVGVIIAFLISQIASTIVQIIYVLDKIKSQIKNIFLKKWLKLSWLTLYPSITTSLYRFDILIFSAITQSVIGVAIYSATLAVGGLAGYSNSISVATYSKLLGSNKQNYLQENLTRQFYFSIPLAAISITFARPALFVLNPIYEIAVLPILFITIQVLLTTLNITFLGFLTGIEKVDINPESTFKEYIKSKLFLLPTIRLIRNAVYLVFLAAGLLLLRQDTSSQLDLVTYWSIIALLTTIPITIYMYILVKRKFTLTLDLRSISKYLLISILSFGMTYVLTEKFLDYKNNIFKFLPNLLFFIGVGIGSYLVITYLVDLRTRKLFKAIVQEIRNKIF